MTGTALRVKSSFLHHHHHTAHLHFQPIPRHAHPPGLAHPFSLGNPLLTAESCDYSPMVFPFLSKFPVVSTPERTIATHPSSLSLETGAPAETHSTLSSLFFHVSRHWHQSVRPFARAFLPTRPTAPPRTSGISPLGHHDDSESPPHPSFTQTHAAELDTTSIHTYAVTRIQYMRPHVTQVHM